MSAISVKDTEDTKSIINTYIESCKKRLDDARNAIFKITIPECLKDIKKGKQSEWYNRADECKSNAENARKMACAVLDSLASAEKANERLANMFIYGVDGENPNRFGTDESKKSNDESASVGSNNPSSNMGSTSNTNKANSSNASGWKVINPKKKKNKNKVKMVEDKKADIPVGEELEGIFGNNSKVKMTEDKKADIPVGEELEGIFGNNSKVKMAEDEKADIPVGEELEGIFGNNSNENFEKDKVDVNLNGPESIPTDTIQDNTKVEEWLNANIDSETWENIKSQLENGEISQEEYNEYISICNMSGEDWNTFIQEKETQCTNGEIAQEKLDLYKDMREMSVTYRANEDFTQTWMDENGWSEETTFIMNENGAIVDKTQITELSNRIDTLFEGQSFSPKTKYNIKNSICNMLANGEENNPIDMNDEQLIELMNEKAFELG